MKTKLDTLDYQHVTPDAIKVLASRGYTKKMIAAKIDLLEDEFEKLLQKKPAFQEAFTLGQALADAYIWDSLWAKRDQDRGVLFALSRKHLNLDDALLDKLAGGVLELAFDRVDKRLKNKFAKSVGAK